MILRLISLLALVFAFSIGAFGQTAPLSGTVTDPSGSVVPGADITVRNVETGAVYQSKTNENGAFIVPSLGAGTYAVAVTFKGFKQAVANDVKINVGVPTHIEMKLEVGSQAETVTVEAVGAILQTQSATVSTTLVGRQIVDLPLVSRDALDLVLFLPNVNTPGRPRSSTVDGLPKGALNITIDGINVQDNLLKSSDGYFTYIRPRLDAIQEVTISTATAGADSTGEGAVQIKFVTRGGTNEYRGSIYEYHRNPVLNSNYWFNNRDLPPDPRTGKAPRARVLLNQFGFRVGGPVSIPKLFSGRNRLFFFVNYEEYRLPEQTLRNRTILNPLTQQGDFRYNTSAGVQTVNLLQLGARNGQTSTLDPIVSKLLADIRSASESAGSIMQLTDPNLQRATFINRGGQWRRFPTARIDYIVSPKHSLEFTYNYQDFAGRVDFLNGTDPAFPGFPNQGSQGSNRWSGVVALRSTLTAKIVNEFRAGMMGGVTLFFPEASPTSFSGPLANQGGFALGISAAGITNAHVVTNPSRRSTPVRQLMNNLSASSGRHTMSMGGTFTQVYNWSKSKVLVPSIGFGVDAVDPANAMFVAANFPGASNTDINNARNIYAVLTGHVNAINANAQLSEDASEYVYIGPDVRRYRFREQGLYFQDNWRINPNLTLNLGLRWEIQYPFIAKNQKFAVTDYNEVFGISGPGNLFKPGASAGKVTSFRPIEMNKHSYKTDYKNFAPSVGFSWSPDVDSGFLKTLFGGPGRGVIRGGYSISYNREGATWFSNYLGANPGGFITANRNNTIGNLVTNTGADVMPVLLRETSRLGPPPFSTKPVFPVTGAVTDQVNVIDPNLRMPMVHSWSFGVQREIGKDMAFEIRYIGNRAVRPWSGSINYNETNILENGMLNEFRLAQQNLQANIAAGRGSNFRYFGPGTGTAPLPITLAYFSGLPASEAGNPARYGSANFANATWVNTLARQLPAPFTYAANLHSDATRRANALAAGLPSNFFLVNPDKRGGAWDLTNWGGSNYNAVTVEFRRRFSQGLLINSNYTFGKAMQYIWVSFRKREGERGVSPLNITHAFKANWIYDLPVGRGKKFLSGSNRLLEGLLGGWGVHGAGRWQSGSPFNIGNVRLIGMTRSELQSMVGVRKEPNFVFFLPQDVIDNTIKANNVSATSSNGYSALGVPSGRYIAPANGPDCVELYAGQCGGVRHMLYGPKFVRFDLSAVKRINITEKVNIEFRGEFLNAFNNTNFIVGSAANDTNSATNFSSQEFGKITAAYQDTSTTNDPGGRLVQLVLRINF
jgi:hypothetical protein